jgi:hypothetical protein
MSRTAYRFLREAGLTCPRDRERLKDDMAWGALLYLREREYWNRVWIVQEIGLASGVRIVCGEDQIPWQLISNLRRVRKSVWTKYLSDGEWAFMRSFPARIDQQREVRQRNDCVLWTLIESFRDSLCQDPLDRVYGFHGLSNDCGSSGLPINYLKSLNELYKGFMRFYDLKFFWGDQSPSQGAQLIPAEQARMLLPLWVF